MVKDHRYFKRVQISLKIRLSESGDEIRIKFDSENISEGGIFIKSSILWEPTQEFTISFALPGVDKEISVNGIVVRNEDQCSLFPNSEEKGTISGMGIEFVNLSEEDRLIIRKYVDSFTNG